MNGCTRGGDTRSGGHCLVCGFDVFPWAGTEVEGGHIVCSPFKPSCLREYLMVPQCIRNYWKTLPAYLLVPSAPCVHESGK